MPPFTRHSLALDFPGFAALAIAAFGLCGSPIAVAVVAAADTVSATDPHSFANAESLRVRHLELALDVDFAQRRLSGTVDLDIDRLREEARRLVLDTRDLSIREVWLVESAQRLVPLAFHKGRTLRTLGEPLYIDLPKLLTGASVRVRISYQTSPDASGLQWLEPRQTADRTHPFLFSQSQAIHARSWIPLQDTPGVRMTYTARIHAPVGLRAVMSADNGLPTEGRGIWRFDMPQPIPSYLMAIAVGRLEAREIGPRTTVFAEPSVLAAAATEFADTPAMIDACEKLYGPYRWGRYDLLILPPAFPYGGMENPRLSFITPTVIAGDRSLVALIAHELAHSWSGNLVTNATWRDFWLNEGFTVYLERQIVAQVFGSKRRDMEDVLGLQSLQRDLKALKPKLQILAVDLRGLDPDDGFSDVPYEKGRLFLGWLSARFGAATLDAFLRRYFEHFAFKSVTTEQFRDYLLEHLLPTQVDAATTAEVDQWLYQPGLPTFAVLPRTAAFDAVDTQRRDWLSGRIDIDGLKADDWSPFEMLHFLDGFTAPLPAARMAQLDRRFNLTDSRNAEIVFSWLQLAIRGAYEPAYPQLEQYLMRIGRRKLIKPLYEAMTKTPQGRERARRIYAAARPGYHPIVVATLDPIVLAPKP